MPPPYAPAAAFHVPSLPPVRSLAPSLVPSNSRKWLPEALLVASLLIGAASLPLLISYAKKLEVKHPSTGQVSKPSTVRMKLTIEPKDARLWVDGIRIATPVDAKVRRDGREHTVRVEAPGYAAKETKVRFEEDSAATLTLLPATLPQPTF